MSCPGNIPVGIPRRRLSITRVLRAQKTKGPLIFRKEGPSSIKVLHLFFALQEIAHLCLLDSLRFCGVRPVRALHHRTYFLA